MKLREEFRVDRPVSTIWEFFEEPERVARCLPGVEQIRVIDPDNVEVRATQSIGPMNATFEAKVSILERQEHQYIRFQAAGKSVRGAVGNLRALNTVQLNEVDGATVVLVEGDVILAGALGSVGQKVVAKQAGKVTAVFADNLRQALAGGPAAIAPAATATTPDAAATTAAPGEWVTVGDERPSPPASERWAKLAVAFSGAAAVFSFLTFLAQRRCRR